MGGGRSHGGGYCAVGCGFKFDVYETSFPPPLPRLKLPFSCLSRLFLYLRLKPAVDEILKVSTLK